MSTDEQGLESRCVFALIEYLERNDFTDILHASRHLIKMKDGGRTVYLWIITDLIRGMTQAVVPSELLRIAELDKARVDVALCLAINGEVRIRHSMNVAIA